MGYHPFLDTISENQGAWMDCTIKDSKESEQGQLKITPAALNIVRKDAGNKTSKVTKLRSQGLFRDRI